MNSLEEVKHSLAKSLFGEDYQDIQESGLCIQCREPALPKCYSEAGRKEFKISGLCEKCFDEIMSPLE